MPLHLYRSPFFRAPGCSLHASIKSDTRRTTYQNFEIFKFEIHRMIDDNGFYGSTTLRENSKYADLHRNVSRVRSL